MLFLVLQACIGSGIGLSPEQDISSFQNQAKNSIGIKPNVVSNNTGQWFEGFESGYDGWSYVTGDFIDYGPKSDIAYEGNYSFKMESFRTPPSGYSGRYQYNITIPLDNGTEFTFAYYFPSKNVSYVGYRLNFNTGQAGCYYSVFYGWYINTSYVYLHQYENEDVETWHTHTVYPFRNYEACWGEAPSDLEIVSVSLITGDPYFSGNIQTAFYDGIVIRFNDDAPTNPSISGSTQGSTETEYEYSFLSIDPDGDNIYYYIDWGDGTVVDWIGPFESMEIIKLNHSWLEEGTYTIRAKAKNIYGVESDWGILEVSMPKNKPSNFNLILRNWLFERFPNIYYMFLGVDC